MRRTAIVMAALVLTSAAGVGTAGARTAVANAGTITITPSTGLINGQSVLVAGGGFDADTPLASAECKNGAVELSDCDLSTTDFPETDDSGAYSFSFVVHTELVTNDGLVDCTAKKNECMIGVANGLDITGTAATAPISFAPPAPPQSGVMHVPSAPVGADNGVEVTGTDYAPLAVVGVALCATAPADDNACAVPMFVTTDETGAFDTFLNTPEVLELQNGDRAHCTGAGNCVFATWDARDFGSTLTTTAMQVAAEVPGTVTVKPNTGLHDGQSVKVSGSGWPAQDYLAIYECNGTGADAVCDAYNSAQVGDDGTFSAPFDVSSHSTTGPFYDCEVEDCSIVVQWYANGGIVSAARPIAFDTTPDLETSHYTADELAAVDGAATTLGMTPAQLQHDASWGLAFVLGITHTTTISPAPDAGPKTIDTNWLPADHSQMTAIAGSEGATLPEFEKTGALFVAYILAISQAHR